MLAFGTRPEAIKMAPLLKEFLKYTDTFQPIVCVTAQHREMLDQVLRLFEIKPDYDLNIMKKGQDLYDLTSGILIKMRDVLQEVKPDIVLVHGDTTTSAAVALAAFYQQIPVGHVEAGLRTGNIYSPYPEEMIGSRPPPDNMFFIEPLDYLPFVYLMQHCYLILTDSGGIQEEAPALGKPVIVMRNTTERPEAISAGTVKLTGTDYDRIITETSLLLDDPVCYDAMHKKQNPYGDGFASKRIASFLIQTLTGKK